MGGVGGVILSPSSPLSNTWRDLLRLALKGLKLSVVIKKYVFSLGNVLKSPCIHVTVTLKCKYHLSNRILEV